MIIKLVVFVHPNLNIFLNILFLGTNIILNVMQLPTKEKPCLSNILDNMWLY